MRIPAVNFVLLVAVLPIAYPLAIARDWWVANGYRVVNGTHDRIDKLANKLYDLC